MPKIPSTIGEIQLSYRGYEIRNPQLDSDPSDSAVADVGHRFGQSDAVLARPDAGTEA